MGSAVWTYLSDKDFEKLKEIAIQDVGINFRVSFAVNYVYDIYINVDAGQDRTPTNSDQCNAEDPAQVAQDFVDSMKAFCLRIQAAQTVVVPTHYTSGEFPSYEDDISGAVNVLKIAVAATAGKFADVCDSVGINWKRKAAALFARAFRLGTD